MSELQEDLFGDGAAYARRTDPDTAHAAAATVDASRLERKVVEALRRAHPYGLTSKEISVALSVHVWSISPRLKPLEAKLLIRRTKERRDRCIVWQLYEGGEA